MRRSGYRDCELRRHGLHSARLVTLLPGLAACLGNDTSMPAGIVGCHPTDTNIGGGSTPCCAMAPNHWRWGLALEISLTTDREDHHQWWDPASQYDEFGNLSVDALLSEEIHIFLNNMLLRHPCYRLTAPRARLYTGETSIGVERRTKVKGIKQ